MSLSLLEFEPVATFPRASRGQEALAMKGNIELPLPKEGEGMDEHSLRTYYVLAMCKIYLYLFSCATSEQLYEG